MIALEIVLASAPVANSTRSTLRLKHSVVIFDGDSISSFQVGVVLPITCLLLLAWVTPWAATHGIPIVTIRALSPFGGSH